MLDIEEKLKEIRRTEDIWVAGPAGNNQIAELEARLGTLPDSYKIFLNNYGALSIGDYHISGITGPDLEEGGGSVVFDTNRFVEEYGLPNHLVIIQADEESPYCLDLSAPGSEKPVVCFELFSKKIKVLSANFDEWLNHILSLRVNG